MKLPRTIAAILWCFVAQGALAQTPASDSPARPSQWVDVRLESGDTLRVQPVASNIFRIRLSPNGQFDSSLLERYGIVQTNWAGGDFSSREKDGVTRIATGSASLEVRAKDGSMRLFDAKGAVICEQIAPQLSRVADSDLPAFKKRQAALAEYFKGEKRKQGQIQVIGSTAQDKTEFTEKMHEFDLPTNSFGATFQIKDEERFYGLGAASYKRLQLRGYAYRMWTQYRGNFGFNGNDDWQQTEGPIPILVSTAGWGVFVNTTWVHYFDVGRYQPDQAYFWGPGGTLDFYLLVGGSMPKVLDLYTQITGRPRLMPEFGYGLTYVGQIMENEHDLLNDSRLFRDRGIPCDIIGLEPQWMKKFYDTSHEKEWKQASFLIPAWMGPDAREGTFVGGLDRTGYKLSLWLVCDDDLTMEEERQVSLREGRDFPAQPDAWFDHLQKFIRNGARCFKMDPERLIQEHVNRKYYNGRSDLENHNLTQILYHKQMCSGYEKFAQQRAMNHYCAAFTGVQHWGATTTGDNGGGEKTLTWMLSYAMSGHMNTSCDMETLEESGIHFGFLQAWSQHNNWSYFTQPWFLTKRSQQLYHDYARLRYSLLPYIYSAAHEGNLTAMPILRPMPLAFPDDVKVANCTTEYMLGDSLLVVAFTNAAYLPAGQWFDYWNGTPHTGPQALTCVYPTNRCGGLFVKAGAIIPYWPEVDFVGEKPIETLTLHIYPGGQSSYTLYEDDGNSLDYLKGAVAKTHFTCDANARTVTLEIEPRTGEYRGMPQKRDYEIWIHSAKPRSVTANGSKTDWSYSPENKSIRVKVTEDAERKTPVLVTCKM